MCTALLIHFEPAQGARRMARAPLRGRGSKVIDHPQKAANILIPQSTIRIPHSFGHSPTRTVNLRHFNRLLNTH
jgi:hypothetical protein